MPAAPLDGRPPLQAVTFDYWNTLMSEETDRLREARIERWLKVLADHGHPLDRRELEAVFERSWKAFVRAWKDNVQYTARHATDHILDDLGRDLPPAARAELEAATLEGGEERTLTPTPNVGDCLERLKSAGLRIGIVCDVGMTPSPALRGHLERNGLLEHFDHWSFSDEVGVYKPHPAIFHHALEGLGAEAERTAHVGDLRRTDVAGARLMGMLSVRYTGIADDDDALDEGEDEPPPEAELVLDDHALLPPALGVA